MTGGPLAGIRVLDLTRIVAGPFATMRMADLGAEVIKVENPDGGDESRQIRPPEAGGEAFYYLAYNRSKRSIAVDLRTEGGKDIIDRLAARSDVLIQNFRVGVMERLGLGYEAVRARHPHLVYCSISAYGRTGPMTARPGFDPVLQAESGMMAITGEPDGPPMRHALSIIDTLTSHYACEAVLAALIARGRSGRGQHIDISLMDGAVASLSNAAQMHLLTGEEPPRTGNRHQSAVPVGMFETRTGPFYMAIGYDRLFREMCAAVGRDDLAGDPRFATGAARHRHRGELYRLLEELFATDSREAWLARLQGAGLPAGPVRTVTETMEAPEVRARSMVREVDHPTAGTLKLVGTPFNFSDSGTARPTAPPLLGQDTIRVLRDVLAMTGEEIAELRKAGAIGGIGAADG